MEEEHINKRTVGSHLMKHFLHLRLSLNAAQCLSGKASTHQDSSSVFTLEPVLSVGFPVGGRPAMVKLSGSSRSRILDSFIRLSSFFLAIFSTCFLLADVWKRNSYREWWWWHVITPDTRRGIKCCFLSAWFFTFVMFADVGCFTCMSPD